MAAKPENTVDLNAKKLKIQKEFLQTDEQIKALVFDSEDYQSEKMEILNTI